MNLKYKVSPHTELSSNHTSVTIKTLWFLNKDTGIYHFLPAFSSLSLIRNSYSHAKGGEDWRYWRNHMGLILAARAIQSSTKVLQTVLPFSEFDLKCLTNSGCQSCETRYLHKFASVLVILGCFHCWMNFIIKTYLPWPS